MNLLLDVASFILLTLGGFFCITAGLGLLRMPDLYTRAHSVSILDSMGAGLVTLGLLLQAPDYLVALKLVFIFFFLLITSLAAIHALAHAVNVAGVDSNLANIVQRLDKNTGKKTNATDTNPESLKPSNS